MNQWQMIIPHIGPLSNLIECLNSMNSPVLPIPLLIVDNSPTGETRRIVGLPGGTEVVYHPENLGVPASWNLGLKRGAHWTLVCSASTRFEVPLAEFLDGAAERAGDYGLQLFNSSGEGMGWHLVIFGKATVDRIGYLDENYYPAYYEDNDYGYRMRVARIGYCEGVGHPTWAGPVHDVGNAIALSSGIVGMTAYDMMALKHYYSTKWGGPPSKELWEHPFNNPANGLDYWPTPKWRPKL